MFETFLISGLHKVVVFLEKWLLFFEGQCHIFWNFINAVKIVRLENSFYFGRCSYLYRTHFENHLYFLLLETKMQSKLIKINNSNIPFWGYNTYRQMHDRFHVFFRWFIECWVHSFEYFIGDREGDLKAKRLPSIHKALDIQIPLWKWYIWEIIRLEINVIAGWDVSFDWNYFAI